MADLAGSCDLPPAASYITDLQTRQASGGYGKIITFPENKGFRAVG